MRGTKKLKIEGPSSSPKLPNQNCLPVNWNGLSRTHARILVPVREPEISAERPLSSLSYKGQFRQGGTVDNICPFVLWLYFSVNLIGQ